MPYIDRDKEGNIRGIYACKQREGQEYIADDSPDMIAYEAEQKKIADNNAVYTKLIEIDQKSIRGIREWIALQPTAEKFTKDLEVEAIKEREKIKK